MARTQGRGTPTAAGPARTAAPSSGGGKPGRPASASGERRAGYGHPWWTLLAVSLGVVMVGLDGTVVAIANPVIGRDLHASLAGLQWVTNGYLLCLAVLMITAGKLADRFGRKRVFLAGVVGFALASLGSGLSTSVGMLVFFRCLQGVAGALLMPSTLALLRAAFPPERLEMAVGIWGGTSAVAIAAGPIVGGLLVQHVSWESVFYINLLVGAVAVGVGARAVAGARPRSSASWPGRRPSWWPSPGGKAPPASPSSPSGCSVRPPSPPAWSCRSSSCSPSSASCSSSPSTWRGSMGTPRWRPGCASSP